MTRGNVPAWAPRRELWAWAFYDFANSGYTTVVLTAIFNAYFVGVVAVAHGPGGATLLWTTAVAVANLIVVLSGPLVGAVADARAAKKRFLVATTAGCVVATAGLAWVGPGDVASGMALLIVSYVMFASGENLISAFLPELAPPEALGRLSARGWALGYVGGLLVLGLCLAWLQLAEGYGMATTEAVPVTMWIVASAFALASLPTLVWLRDRTPPVDRSGVALTTGWRRLTRTWHESRRFPDLRRFLVTLTVYHAGIQTVIVLATIYAQQAMGFGTVESLWLILVVNVTAALGAVAFGQLQDRIGSVRTLALALGLWLLAGALAWLAEGRALFWVAANLVGIAMGASQSAGRALVGRFAPAGRTAEFFGLWGMAVKLAAIVGPMAYGLLGFVTGGDHRTALLSTLAFFAVGLLLLRGIDEQRGMRAAGRA
ncbi:MAG: MFS transporter [Gammaproteobacteria bacterium]|nr:MFS transporter [Gammaproteobacteria bacterium]